MSSYKYTRGESLNALLQMDPNRLMSLPAPALRETVKRLADAANKRVRAQAGDPSPAIRQAQRGGKFSTRGKDVQALRSEYLRARRFLSSPTSTKKGWNAYKKEVGQALRDEGWHISSDQIGEAINLFEKLTQADEEVLDRATRYKYLRDLADMTVELDSDDPEGATQAEPRDGKEILSALATALAETGYSGGDDDGSHGDSDGGVSQFFNLI